MMHDLILPGGGGTIHFDHIIVSQFGIHVIDTVHRSGWIYGTKVQARWRQESFGRRHQFENPVHANFIRVQALERLLQLPLSRFHGMVVFTGHRGFKTEIPGNVVSVRSLIRKIRADSRQLLTPDEADRALLKLQSSVVQPSFLGPARRWKLLRLLLLILLVAGVYLVYGDSLRTLLHDMQKQADVSMAPEKYHANGQPKSETELWEDSLVCAYSVDTGRCACYQANGIKARIGQDRCEELAQRGSILRQ